MAAGPAEHVSSSAPDHSRTVHWLSGVYGVAACALLAATWRLWIGQMQFPQVPLFEWACGTPGWIDGVLLTGMLVGLGATFCRRLRNQGWLLFAAAWGALALLDQHRIQVWAWHLALCGLLISLSDPDRRLSRLRWLTVAIYAWSAWSRMDPAFVSGVGRQIAQGLIFAAGGERTNPDTLSRIAALFPAGEALTAALLALPVTRRYGLAASLVMHLGLLIALGPWGLGHEPGVLLWNALFLIQNPLLFARRSVSPDVSGSSSAPQTLQDRLAAGLLGFAAALPALQPWGFWDVWPSWAVYSARGGWTTVLVHAEDAERLPEICRPWLREAAPFSDWRPLDIDGWSRHVLRCPVNPESRFRVGVASALAEGVRLRIEQTTAPDRWTGKTDVHGWVTTGTGLPPSLKDQFWLNTQARRPMGR